MSRLHHSPTVGWRDLGVTTLFLALSVAIYWPVFQGRVPLPTDIPLEQTVYRTTAFFPEPAPHPEMRDLTSRIYPARQYAAESLSNGRLPEWNARTLGGAPFIANARSAVFYPPHFLYSLVDVPTAWSLLFILHMTMAGTFTFLFLREIGSETPAAVGGGMVFALCGSTLAWQGFPEGAAGTWLPLIAFAAARLRRQPGPGTAVLTAFSLAMPVLAGSLEAASLVVAVGLTVAGFELVRPQEEGAPQRLHFFGFLTLSTLLAVLLAAVQWLPTIEWMSMTTPSLDFQWSARDLMDAIALVSRDLTRNPNADGVPIPDGAAYAGILPLVVAPIAIVGIAYRFGGRGPAAYAGFFGALAALAASVVYGIGPTDRILSAVPVLGGLEHPRFGLVLDFSFAALAGIGLTMVTRAAEEKSVARWSGPILASFIGGIVYGIAPEDDGLVAGAVAISVVLVIARSGGLLGRASFLGLALVLLAADLVTFGYGHAPFVERSTIFPDVPAVTFVEQNAGTGNRSAFVDDVADPNLAMLWGMEALSGDDRVLGRVRTFLSGYADPASEGLHFPSASIVAASDRRLDMLNVRFLVTPIESAARMIDADPDRFGAVFVDGPVAVVENRNVLPRAYLVPARGIEFISDRRTRLDRVRDPGFDPVTRVILPAEPAFAPGSTSQGPESAVRFVEYRGDAMRLEVEADTASVLVLGQIFHPGWSLTVNGREREPLETNFIFTGIGLEAGFHVVELTFESRSLRTGATLSVAGMFLVISLVAVGHRLRLLSRRFDVWEAEDGTAMAIVVISLVAFAFTGLIAADYYRPGPEPPVPDDLGVEVSPAELMAGTGAVTVRLDGIWDVDVPIRYRIGNARTEVGTVRLDREGDQGVGTIDVPAEAPRGLYQLVEVGVPGMGWVEVDQSVRVR